MSGKGRGSAPTALTGHQTCASAKIPPREFLRLLSGNGRHRETIIEHAHARDMRPREYDEKRERNGKRF